MICFRISIILSQREFMKKLKLSTTIDEMKRKDIHRILTIAFDWCINNFGIKKGIKKVNLKIMDRGGHLKEGNVAGSYAPSNSCIQIYWKNNSTIKMLINTLLHEYRHYCQSENWGKIEKNWIISGKYVQIPSEEKDANQFANRFYSSCWKFVKLKEKSA